MKYLLILAMFCFAVNFVSAQDSDFIRGKKTLDQIEKGFKYLKRGDVKSYNDLSAKLANARKLLESTTSKNHKDYQGLVNRWNAAKDKLIAIANEWKQAPAQQPQLAAQPRQTATQNKADAARQRYNNQATSQQSSKQIYNSIIQKYQRQNRPKLPEGATPEQATSWAQQMLSLAGEQLTADTQTIEAGFAAGKVNKQDKNRFDRWVRRTWYNEILQQLNQAKQSFERHINNALNQADFINNADENDDNKIMNIGGENYYSMNAEMLQAGLDNIKIVTALEQALNQPAQETRESQRQKLELAQGKLEQFKTKDAEVRKKLAVMPKKPKKKTTSQMLWLDGSRFCEITQKGEVWINSNYKGAIEDNGKIWVNGNNVGSIEKNGDVWHSGNHVGTLTHNGEVWKSGSQVGLITHEGEVWIGSSSRGNVEGPGDWRRAAIVYYFKFY